MFFKKCINIFLFRNLFYINCGHFYLGGTLSRSIYLSAWKSVPFFMWRKWRDCISSRSKRRRCLESLFRWSSRRDSWRIRDALWHREHLSSNDVCLLISTLLHCPFTIYYYYYYYYIYIFFLGISTVSQPNISVLEFLLSCLHCWPTSMPITHIPLLLQQFPQVIDSQPQILEYVF